MPLDLFKASALFARSNAYAVGSNRPPSEDEGDLDLDSDAYVGDRAEERRSVRSFKSLLDILTSGERDERRLDLNDDFCLVSDIDDNPNAKRLDDVVWFNSFLPK